jgi:endonuclease/exonuclease/phosphatase family metal-dependent hydrolase
VAFSRPRWPHRFVTQIDLRITDRTRNTLSWCAAVLVELDTPVGTVVVAHHKPSLPFPFEHEREQQAVLVACALEEHIGSRDLHAVVLGDFDATPDSASLLFWRGRRSVDGLSVCCQDAWEYAHPNDPGYTFEVTNPLVRDGEVATAVTRKVDHVLVRRELHGPSLQVARCERVLDRPSGDVWASGHFSVLADLVSPISTPGFRSSCGPAWFRRQRSDRRFHSLDPRPRSRQHRRPDRSGSYGECATGVGNRPYAAVAELDDRRGGQWQRLAFARAFSALPLPLGP